MFKFLVNLVKPFIRKVYVDRLIFIPRKKSGAVTSPPYGDFPAAEDGTLFYGTVAKNNSVAYTSLWIKISGTWFDLKGSTWASLPDHP